MRKIVCCIGGLTTILLTLTGVFLVLMGLLKHGAGGGTSK